MLYVILYVYALGSLSLSYTDTHHGDVHPIAKKPPPNLKYKPVP